MGHAKKQEESSFSDLISEELIQDLQQTAAEQEAELLSDLMSAVEPDAAKEPVKASRNDDTQMIPDVGPFEAGQSVEVPKFKPSSPLMDLKNADYIKFAQNKIKTLEAEMLRLQKECEELALAGDHFKSLAEEQGQKLKALEGERAEGESLFQEEKKILNESLSSKEIKIQALQTRVEVLEGELESKFHRIKRREQELESRLEIMKREQEAVTQSKDNMILRLNKNNAELQAQLERLRAQNQKFVAHLQEKEDALRRTVKALKLSLTMLENKD